MGALLHDVKYGLRILAKNPGFTAVAIVTLALGIGANTAMFSVVYGVLLRPLPYPHPERIVGVALTRRGELERPMSFTAGGFDFWKEHSKPFQYLAASTDEGFNLGGAERAERLDALRVSSDYFRVYGVEPFLGRSFSSAEDSVGGPNVAVLSYGLWKEQFGGDRRAIGRTVLLNGAPYTVIGVMPAGFASIPPASLWTTIGQVRNSIGGGWNYDLIGRLKPGVSLKQASAYVGSIAQPFLAEFAPGMAQRNKRVLGFAATPYRYTITSDIRTPLLILFGAIGFVLLIACVNVANLLLARTASRNREIALRAALGAGRGRIVRQLLTESVLLAAGGAALGLLVAFWSLHFLLALAPASLPRAAHVALNGWALIFTAGAAALTGILFGLAPALQATSVNLNESLKEGEGRASFSRRRQRLSGAMVSTEVALSLVLLIGSGLLIRTFVNSLLTNPGFDPHHVLTLQIWTTGSKYDSTPKLAGLYQRFVRRIDAIPGVPSAAIVAAGLPLERGGNDNPGVRVHGQLHFPSVDYREITPDYFVTLRNPMVVGRPFAESDSPDSTKVTIINTAFAATYFHNQNPLGHHLILHDAQAEIVGVAGDVRSSMNEPAPPTFFVPMAQTSYGTDQLFQGYFPTSILVRTAGKPLALSRAVENAVRGAAPDIPIGKIRSMEQVLSVSLAFQRFLMTLMSVFAGLALVLAAVGIYGVLSYWVSQRTREIGIRMALGAQRRDVLSAVMRQGLTLAAVGLAAGLIAALFLTRLIAGVLYDVKPADPMTFVAVSVALIAVAVFACYIPARRATKVDPMVALRYE